MSEIDFEKKHLANVVRSMNSVERSMMKGIDDLAKEVSQYDIRNPKAFDWSRHTKLDKRVNVILGELNSGCYKKVRDSMVMSWNLANQKNDFLTNQFLKNASISTGVKQQYFNQNISALNSWINRVEDGIKLSDKIWQTTQDMKMQLQTHIGNGIATGKSAAAISRDIRNVLKDPNKLFRRVNKDGKLVLSNPAKNFHPGSGKYRSSYKNALRLTATETNMAYRMSDFTRRGQLDFVVGFEVHLSGSHPRPDICDDLKGKYPKDFVFRGWHPWCLCFTTSILQSHAEYKREQAGGVSKKRESVQGDGSGVKKASDWAIEHNDYLQKTKSAPYFIADNFYIGGTQNGNAYLLKEGILKKVTYKAGQTIVSTVEEAEAEMIKWWNSGDGKARGILKGYTDTDYININKRLLGIDTYLEENDLKELDEKIKVLQDFLKKGSEWKSTSYRGTYASPTSHKIVKEAHENLLRSDINHEFSSDAFLSSSIKKTKADYFGRIKPQWDDPANFKVITESEAKTMDIGNRSIHVRFQVEGGSGSPVWKYSNIDNEMEIIGTPGIDFKILSKEVRLVKDSQGYESIFVLLKIQRL